MKKLSISLLLIGLGNLGYTQNTIPNKNEPIFTFDGHIKSNSEYLREVQNTQAAIQVKILEKEVALWDPAKSKEFDEQKEQPFAVTFKTGKGYIVASYDKDGKILTAEERFKNIALPNQVSVSIAQTYPSWTVAKTKYSLLYAKGKETQKNLKVLIKKENQKKWIKINPSGRIT